MKKVFLITNITEIPIKRKKGNIIAIIKMKKKMKKSKKMKQFELLKNKALNEEGKVR